MPTPGFGWWNVRISITQKDTKLYCFWQSLWTSVCNVGHHPTFNRWGFQAAADPLHVSVRVLDLVDSLGAPQLHKISQLRHGDPKLLVIALSDRVPRRVVHRVVGHVASLLLSSGRWVGGGAKFCSVAALLLDVSWLEVLVITWWLVKMVVVALTGCNQRTSRLAPDQGGHAPLGYHANQRVNMFLPLQRKQKKERKFYGPEPKKKQYRTTWWLKWHQAQESLVLLKLYWIAHMLMTAIRGKFVYFIVWLLKRSAESLQENKCLFRLMKSKYPKNR